MRSVFRLMAIVFVLGIINCLSKKEISLSDFTEAKRIKEITFTTFDNKIHVLTHIYISYESKVPRIIGFDKNITSLDHPKTEISYADIKKLEITYCDLKKTCFVVGGTGCVLMCIPLGIIAYLFGQSDFYP